MPGHFSIDVHPGQLEHVEKALGKVGRQLSEEGGKLGGLPGQAGEWTGRHAGALKQAMVLLSRDMGDATPKLEDAVDALGKLRQAYEDAKDQTIPSLNRRWDDAITAHQSAVSDAESAYDRSKTGVDPRIWRAEQSSFARVRSNAISAAAADLEQTQRELEKEYDQLVDDLHAGTTRCGGALAGAVMSKVSKQAAARYAASGELPDLAFAPWLAADYLRGRPPMAHGGADLHAPYQLAAMRLELEKLRARGVDPGDYKDLLQRYWTAVAASKAGIDLEGWDPEKGVDANRDIIEAVYSYYGQLYLEHPRLQWAGMANMIGPSFAGGFFDLDMFADLADRIGGPVGDIPGPLVPLLPPGLRELSALSQLSEAEVRYYESTLLGMQKEIFVDMAPQHEAYLAGGMPAIDELRAAGLVDRETRAAWADIDSGDPATVQRGNEYLLYREQYDIIEDDYQNMYTHLPSGPAVTYLMGAVGQPSIPDAKTLGEVDPLVVTVESPGSDTIPFTSWDNPTQGSMTLTTNLPAGNIANFDTRWGLITEDTLPAYQQLLRDDPERARDIIGSDVGGRIEEYRLANQWDETVGRLTDIDVDIDQ